MEIHVDPDNLRTGTAVGFRASREHRLKFLVQLRFRLPAIPLRIDKIVDMSVMYQFFFSKLSIKCYEREYRLSAVV